MKIGDFRLSCIWGESPLDAFAATGHGLMGGLMQPSDYAARFNAILGGGPDPELTAPWHPSGPTLPLSNAFWRKYAVGRLMGLPAEARGREAFKAIVPFKRPKPLVSLDSTDRCFVESWFHPHGVLMMATRSFRAGYDLAGFRDAAAGFMHGSHQLAWCDGTSERLKLEGVAMRGLARLRGEAFGAVNPGSSFNPLRVLTIVGVRSEQGEDIAASFDAILGAAADAVGGRSLATPDDARGDIRMLTKGRVICNRAKVAQPDGRTHTLGCLHRNVTLATAQVASLLGGATAALAALEQANGDMSPRIERYVRQLAEQLGTIHQGVDTYDQACVQRQARDETKLINRLRAVVPLAPLA